MSSCSSKLKICCESEDFDSRNHEQRIFLPYLSTMAAVTLGLNAVFKCPKTELAFRALEIFKHEAVTLVKMTAC